MQMHAMQDALLHLQFTVPHEVVDAVMVNGILNAAALSAKSELQMMQH